MKQVIQKIFVVCSLLSLASMLNGYSWSVRNDTIYDGQIDLAFWVPGVCGTDTKVIPAKTTVRWSDASGCLGQEIFGHIEYNNPNNPLVPRPVRIGAHEENRWSGSLDGGSFVMTLEESSSAFPLLKIQRTAL